MDKKFFAANRKKLAKRLPNNAYLVMFAGAAPFKRGDETYMFAPKRNFYYLTGIEAPRAIFSLRKDKNGKVSEKIYVERFDETQAKWTGTPLSANDAEEASGVDDAGFVDEFDDEAAAILFGHAPTVYLDLENRSLNAPVTEDVAFADVLRGKFPAVTIADVYPIMAGLRSIKTDEEVAAIKDAIAITREGVYAAMRKAEAGMREYEVEAAFGYEVRRLGSGYSFNPIIASGGNAATLHYDRNDGVIPEDSLLLCDVGAQVGWYAADISRTFPASGKFTDRQRLLYDIVLEAHDRTIGAIKAGLPYKSLNETVKDYYAKALKKIKLIHNKEEVAEYYYHGVSHPLGLETHDIGRYIVDELAAGMVITVEPGLYIAEEGIGIRIEDDVLVTEKGAVVLSADIIRTADDIERYMSENRDGARRERGDE